MSKENGNKSLVLVEKAILDKNFSSVPQAERLQYCKELSKTFGINFMTGPFDFIKVQGKTKVHANKNCAEQLCAIHGISVDVLSQEMDKAFFIATAKAIAPDGRYTVEAGVVSFYFKAKDRSGGYSYRKMDCNEMVNAKLKAVTKAKRRAVLSLCGVGMMDESELESIDGVEKEEFRDVTPKNDYKNTSGTAQRKTKPKNYAPQSQQPVDEPAPWPDEEPKDEKQLKINPVFGDYVCMIGKEHRGKRLDEIGDKKLKGFVGWLEEEGARQGKTPPPNVKEFIEQSNAYLYSGS